MFDLLITGGLGFAVLATSMNVINGMGWGTHSMLRWGFVLLCVSGFMGVLYALQPDLQLLQWSWGAGAIGLVMILRDRHHGVDCRICLYKQAALKRERYGHSTDRPHRDERASRGR